jgi:hypothetical protein
MRVVLLVGATLRLAVPVYLSTVLLGLIPTTVAMLGLVPLAGDRPWRTELLSPGWMNLVAELAMTLAYSRDAASAALLLVAALVLLPLAVLGQLVAYSFLAGGILETLRVVSGARPPFWAACRDWFWPFLRLSLLGGVLVVVAAVIGVVLARLARPVVGPDVAALLQYTLQAMVLGWLELARAVMVVESLRSVGVGLGRASRAALRPLVLAIWLLISLPGAGLLLLALLPPSVDDPYAPGELVRALVFGQAVALGGAWTKVVRLAVSTRLAYLTRPTASTTASGPAARAG